MRRDNAIKKQYDNDENTALEIRALPLPDPFITHSYMMRANAYMNMNTTTHIHKQTHTHRQAAMKVNKPLLLLLVLLL